MMENKRCRMTQVSALLLLAGEVAADLRAPLPPECQAAADAYCSCAGSCNPLLLKVETLRWPDALCLCLISVSPLELLSLSYAEDATPEPPGTSWRRAGKRAPATITRVAHEA